MVGTSSTPTQPLDAPGQPYDKATLALCGLQGFSRASQDDGTFRDLLLDWNRLPTLTSAGEPLPVWVLCCDVLRISRDVVLDQDTFVFARRIEVSNGSGLILNRTDGVAHSLTLVAQEVIDTTSGIGAGLSITATSGEGENRSLFAPAAGTPATGIVWESHASQWTPLDPAKLDDGWLNEGDPLRLSLDSLFQVATLIASDHPALSVAQLRWISTLASSSADTRDLGVQASSLAMTLASQQAETDGTLLVPRLDLEIYGAAAASWRQLLVERQARLTAYQSQLASDEAWVDQANAALETIQSQVDLDQRLEAQAKDSRDQLLRARSIAANQVAVEQALTAQAAIGFSTGIEIWASQRERGETFSLVLGIGKILAQIPAMLVAGPELEVSAGIQSVVAGASAAATATKKVFASLDPRLDLSDLNWSDELGERPAVAEGVGPPVVDAAHAPAGGEPAKHDAANGTSTELARASMQEALVSAGEAGKGVVEAAIRIAEITEMADHMEATSNHILSATSMTTGEAFASVGVHGLDVVTGGSQQWTLLEKAIDDMFEGITVLRDIEGGTDYHLAIRRLIAFGQALSQCKLAVAKATAQLAEAKMRRVAAQKAVAIAAARVKKAGDQKAHDDMISQLVFGRVLDAKRSIYLAFEAYRRAFAYFTLREAPALPRLTDSVDKFCEAVGQISDRKLELAALTATSGVPQPMAPVLHLTDGAFLDGLRANGFASWDLGVDCVAFRGFGRVRFKEVRIYPEGLVSIGDVTIQIATSGVYTDKIPGTVDASGGFDTARFVSTATQMTFVYDGTNPSTIHYWAAIAPRYENDFFVPTPFTGWTMMISGPSGSTLDLNAITGVRMEFSGEATRL